MQYRALTQTTRIILIALVALTVTGTSGVAAGTPSVEGHVVAAGRIVAGSSPNPLISVSGATAEEQGLVKWAIERFEVAGLPLPPVTVTFHETTDGCRGYQGYYSSSTKSVDVCNRGGGKTDQRHTLLHELAHAWTSSGLTGGEKDAFTERRGLDHWRSPDVAWWQMGQEQAAEIIAWGLQDGDEFKSIWLFLEECDQLARDFETLTGTTPLHHNTGFCTTE